jgi:hypothetical protein
MDIVEYINTVVVRWVCIPAASSDKKVLVSLVFDKGPIGDQAPGFIHTAAVVVMF